MKKRFAVRGSIISCIVPALMLGFALYSVITLSVAASAGGNLIIGVFDIIKRIAGVI